MMSYDSLLILIDSKIDHHARRSWKKRCGNSGTRKKLIDCRNGHVDATITFTIPHTLRELPIKTSLDKRKTYYTFTRCFCDGDYCHLFAIALSHLDDDDDEEDDDDDDDDDDEEDDDDDDDDYDDEGEEEEKDNLKKLISFI